MIKWLKTHSLQMLTAVSVCFSLGLTAYVYFASKWDLTATGTVALACFGCIGIIFNYTNVMALKRDRRPLICVDMAIERPETGLISIRVSNVGNESARNIKITVLAPDTEDLLVKSNNGQRINDSVFFKYPILFMAPDTIRSTIYASSFSFDKLIEQDLIYTFKLKYEDGSGNLYKDEIKFDMHVLFVVYSHSKDVQDSLKKQDERLAVIAQSTLRIANYLDGAHLALFDKINLVANNSLKEDIRDILEGCDSEDKLYLSREETLDKCLGKTNKSMKNKDYRNKTSKEDEDRV